MRLAPLFLLCSTLLCAQSGPGRGEGPRPNLQDGPLAARLFQLRMSRIQQTLGLPEEQAKAIAERWKRFDVEFMSSAQRLGSLRQRFNEILRGPGTEDEKGAQLKPLLEQFLAQRGQQEQARHRFEEDLRGSFKPAQQARLILLMEDLHHELGDIMKETMREQRQGRGK